MVANYLINQINFFAMLKLKLPELYDVLRQRLALYVVVGQKIQRFGSRIIGKNLTVPVVSTKVHYSAIDKLYKTN
jgi:ABC-type taurine transport system substrate-binding protein